MLQGIQFAAEYASTKILLNEFRRLLKDFTLLQKVHYVGPFGKDLIAYSLDNISLMRKIL